MAFFTSSEIETLSASTVRMGLLSEFRFASGTKRVWNGTEELETGGNTYKPMYGYGSIEGLSLQSGVTSQKVTFQLNGLPDQAVDLLGIAVSDPADVDQKLAIISIQLFGDDWQPTGSPIPLWWGFMQPPRISRTPMQGAEGGSQNITMEAENAFFNRSRPPYGRYTDRDQQARHSGDKFFQFTPSLLFKTFVYPDY